MIKIDVFMLAAAASAAVGACSQKPGRIDSARAAPSASAHTSVAQGDLPRIREGLWAATVSIENPYGASIHDATAKICEGGASLMLAKAGRHCSKMSFRRMAGGSITLDSACADGEVATTSHTVYSGDFASAFTSEDETRLTMAGRPPRTMKLHKAFRYLGPCAPGQRPDDPE